MGYWAAARAALPAAVEVLAQAAGRGADVTDLLARTTTLPIPSSSTVSATTEYTWDSYNYGDITQIAEWNFGNAPFLSALLPFRPPIGMSQRLRLPSTNSLVLTVDSR